MYSRLGGCLGRTAKLGHLANTDLWVWVKGLLDRLITHLALGSSSELPLGDPQGLLTIALAACLLAWGTTLSPWELVLTAWREVLTALELVLSACREATLSPWEIMLTAWEDVLIAWESSVIYLGTSCLDSTISLGVNAYCLGTTCLLGDVADCLGRGTGCLGISALCLVTTCLRGRGAGCLGTSTLCPGTTCLRGNSTSTACLGISPVGKPTYALPF